MDDLKMDKLDTMDRIKKLMIHPLYKKYMRAIEEAETERKFCLHGYEHSLDVARICYIINLEDGFNINKEVIYAMALLHDIGRAKEYEEGIGHHIAGAEIAKLILSEIGFSEDEIANICIAISSHKYSDNAGENKLAKLLYKADKLSRSCFACKAYDECYWNDSLKNRSVEY